MKTYTNNEKYVSNVIIFLATCEGLIVTLINYLSKGDFTYSIAFIVVSAILLLWQKEKIFKYLVRKISPNKERRAIKQGKSLLDIKYKDDEGVIQHIHGSCDIIHSVVGVKIEGDKLVDANNTNIVKKDKWIAESAEIITQDDNEILIYLYKIPTESTVKKEYNEMKFEKVGIVVAHKEENDNEVSYRGKFRDVPLNKEQNIREGEVVLTL